MQIEARLRFKKDTYACIGKMTDNHLILKNPGKMGWIIISFKETMLSTQSKGTNTVD
jgi:hypothetical protein